MEWREQYAARTGLATLCACGIGGISMLLGLLVVLAVAFSRDLGGPLAPPPTRLATQILATAAAVTSLSGMALASAILAGSRRAYVFFGMWVSAAALCLAVLAKDGWMRWSMVISTVGFVSWFARGAFTELRRRERD